jgi:hypothetical protein
MKKQLKEASNPALIHAKLIKRILNTAHGKSVHFKTSETSELQSKNSDDPESRLDGTTSVARIYKKSTPGQ